MLVFGAPVLSVARSLAAIFWFVVPFLSLASSFGGHLSLVLCGLLERDDDRSFRACSVKGIPDKELGLLGIYDMI